MTTRAERAERSAAIRAWEAGGRQGPRPGPRDPERDGRRTPAPGGPTSDPPRLVAVVNDVHLTSESPSWRAFRRWHHTVRPHHTIMLGDLIDAAMCSRHEPHKDDPVYLLAEIEALVEQANGLAAECEKLTLCIGNHDKRVETYLRGSKPQITRGLRGLTLPELTREHGLDERVEWFEETAERPSYRVAQFHLQHGHNGSGRFGAGMHLAAAAIAKSNGESVLRGHNHRAQMFCRSAFGKTAIGIASPCMVKPMGYAPNADWQTGFTVLLLRPPTFDWATPYVVICDDEGGFSWGDRYYSGRP